MNTEQTLQRESLTTHETYAAPPAPERLSWGAILAGAVASLGIWALLFALGLALGFSSVDPNNPGSVRSSGIFTGIWGLVSPLVALFVGGLVAGRGAGRISRMGGGVHGLVVWSLTALAGAWLAASLLSGLLGGVASVGKSAISAGAGAVAGAADQAGGVGGVAQSFGLNAEDALKPVNDRLRAEGKPAVTAEQLQAAARDVVKEGVREGQLNRDLLTRNLAQNTALSRSDAEDIANRVEAQFSQAKEQLGQTAQAVQTGALKAADATGKAFWGVFAAMLLGLISSVLGAITGVSRLQRASVSPSRVRVESGVASRREVHP